MKTAVLAILAIGVTATVAAQPRTPDFRSFAWGAAFEEVQQNETAALLSKDKDDLLVYREDLGGYDCTVSYSFNEADKLVSATYAFTKKYANPQLYLQDYNSFKDLLTQKYGPPAVVNDNATPTGKTVQGKSYRQLSAEGLQTFSAEWLTNRTRIEIVLENFNRSPLLQIHYTMRSLTELEDKAALQTALPKL